MHVKIILIIVCGFTFLSTLQRQVIAAEIAPNYSLLIVNQVRGPEFNQSTLVDNTKYLLSEAAKRNMPVFYTVRYDALMDDKLVALLRQYALDRLGVLVEVTPSLAEAANVTYKGNGDNWYKAQHLFTVGYTPEERQRMIDVLVDTFETKIGYTPELATAWVIDTASAQQLRSRGVKAIEITKEQWGTDSYTLTGGPQHYPYIPSSSWIFTPSGEKDAENMPIILRQTVDDPLRNYADRTSAFTTQPNDYVLDGKDITYFKRLLHQALAQQPSGQPGFALLGIENSMDRKHLDEFLRQLDHVHQLTSTESGSRDVGDSSVIPATEPESMNALHVVETISQLLPIAQDNAVYIYCGADIVGETDQSSCWIGTDSYKVRVRQDGDAIFISDVRLYDDAITDPYDEKVSKEGSFWIQPFLLDGQYEITPPKKTHESKSVSNLTRKEANRSKLELPPKKSGSTLKWSKSGGNIELTYLKQDGSPIEIIFAKDEIIYQNPDAGISDFTYVSKDTYPIKINKRNNSLALTWKSKLGENSYAMTISCQLSGCTITPRLNAYIFDNDRYAEYQYFYPQADSGTSDDTKVKARVHNDHAIAGRNPIRILVNRFDKYGIASGLTEDLVVETDKNIVIKQSSSSAHIGQKIVDLYADSAQVGKVVVKSPEGNILITNHTYFVPNCKQEMKRCLVEPYWLLHYAQTLISDKTRDLVLPQF